MDCTFPNLTIVVAGNSAAIQFGQDNILLGEEQPNTENTQISRIVPLQRKISECHVTVINMTGLHETELNLDPANDVIGQLVHENEITAFIFVVQLGQLTDADKMGLEWLQRVFGEEVLQFVMILFIYETEEECDTITDDLKKNPVLERLLEKCGGRYHTCSKIMNNQPEMTELLNKIDCLFIENKQQHYTVEMYNTAREREGLQKSQYESDEPTINKEMDPTTTTETEEKHSGTAEEQTTENEGLGEGPKALFHRLHLDKHQFKLRAADVLQLTAHSLQSHESCAEEELIQTFIHKLLMMDYKARCIHVKTDEEGHTQQCNNDSFKQEADFDDFYSELMLDNKTSKSDPVHPMDVQMAAFHCADGLLKQLMVTKLSQCQYALPLLVPDPFTQQIAFPLWTFRQINKSWKTKNTDNKIISQNQPVYKAQTPMVSFFRFGSVSSSKSQLMNSLINVKHNTFFHRNCPGSSRTRVLMDGVVEITWFCPSGKNTDKFNDCVAFCNLHGDAGDHEKQLQVLTEMTSVNVVLLPQLQRNDERMIQVEKLYNDSKQLICLFAESETALIETRKGKYKIGLKNRSQSDISEELRRAINGCISLSSSDSTSTFVLEDVSKHSDIRVDEEDDDDCRSGKEAAQQMMSLLENKKLTEIKESVLPYQGKLWHQWCQKNKELHRPQANELDTEWSEKSRDLMKIREQQHEQDISEFMKLFIKEINSVSAKRMFFLKWLQILLDENTSADLSALHQKYNEQWSTVIKLKENNEKSEQLKTEQTKLEGISEELQAAAFGLEHIMREIGQIFESCSSVQKIKEGLESEISSLPSLAAEMMISGFPLELMDGDAAHVPVIWISAVVDELIKKLGDMRVFVISVLGVQSSGKSTMLNAMFGLQFAVSAGRCTRGAFMQLVRVSDEMKAQLNLDYILVIDTEGLRSSETAVRSTRHHDNEIATFVVGLANVTLINIFGENPAEMQDILQIVVQAFLRMKKVRLNPSCVFVHQNVSDVTAVEKNMEGRRRLQETLDEMTKLAAKEEVYDAECFSDVIEFDVMNDVKYFAQLWEGNPPMAPTNPNYCENIQELKETIKCHVNHENSSKSDRTKLIDLKDRIKELWEALLNERFVFSFQNSLEIAAYRRLETKYNQWSWTLRSAMLVVEYKLHNKIENEEIDDVKESDLKVKLKEISEGVKCSMSEFFEKDTDAGILIQWKNSFEIKIQELQETIIRETNRKLNGMLQQRDLKKKIDSQRTHHENILFEKSKELALKLKDQEKDEETLKNEFDLFWKECVKKIITDNPIKDIDIMKEVKLLLSDIYKSAPVDPWRESSESTDVFSVSSYSDYVPLKKSSGFTGHIKNAIKAAKEKIGCALSKEDEIQIGIFVTDVAHQVDKKIMSFNIVQMGFNVSCIQQLVDYIKTRVRQHQEGPVKYVFKNEFSVYLVYCIFERANKTLTQQHRLFREANDPVLYLENKKKEYYSIFQKHLQGAASSVIFGEILCQKLKERIEQSIFSKSARDLINDIRLNCKSLNGDRINLEKHILKFLAEEENFSAYMDYINYPREHFENFISDEVSQYMTHNFSVSVLPKIKENIELLQKKIMEAVRESTERVQTNSGNVDLWLKIFTQHLSDVLIFSEKDLNGVKHDDVDDFNLLESVIKKALPSIMPDTNKEFNKDTFYEKLDLKDRPDKILIDQFCQCCWVKCPFCKATCTKTENHDGNHRVLLHRITGINGHYYDGTKNLCTDFCTDAVASNYCFKKSDKWISYKEYRTAGDVYANWNIMYNFSQPYWKWFVWKFQKHLEEYYEKSFKENGRIPSFWRSYTKNEAIESLFRFRNPFLYQIKRTLRMEWSQIQQTD